VLRRARKALNAKNNDTVEEKSVAKKSKKLAKKGGNYELVAQIQGSANEITNAQPARWFQMPVMPERQWSQLAIITAGH
jgi:hypothetical protein